MLNTTISVFDIFPYDCNIDRNAGLAEYGIYPVQGLKSSFVGIGIPGLPGGYIHAFYTLTLGGFHRTFEEDAERLDGLLRLGGHSVAVTLVKHPFTHIYKFIFEGYFGGFENRQYSVHDLRTDPISIGNSNFSHNSFFSCCKITVKRYTNVLNQEEFHDRTIRPEIERDSRPLL